MSTDIEKARAVAADLLRQAGDETGARVLERAGRVQFAAGYALEMARDDGRRDTAQLFWDLCAYLDPAWAKAELERARAEALEMHEARKRAARRRRQYLRESSDSLLPRRPPFVSPIAAYRAPMGIAMSDSVQQPDGSHHVSVRFDLPVPHQDDSASDEADRRGEWDPDGSQD